MSTENANLSDRSEFFMCTSETERTTTLARIQLPNNEPRVENKNMGVINRQNVGPKSLSSTFEPCLSVYRTNLKDQCTSVQHCVSKLSVDIRARCRFHRDKTTTHVMEFPWHGREQQRDDLLRHLGPVRFRSWLTQLTLTHYTIAQ